jgi:RNA polymerase sigma-70 factor (ECF subfamily)
VGGRDETNRARPTLYCIVPGDLAGKLHEPLRTHFRDDPQVEVVVERRLDDRRSRLTRREADDSARRGEQDERRRIKSQSGRRVAERRALATPAGASPPLLPKKARRYADRLVFLERLEPSTEGSRDAESKRLVTRYQAGDEAVFGELYLRYFNPVYTYARVALKRHHEAEDVTQQVFIRALGALGRYELRAAVPFRAWLFAIARNVIVDAVRELHSLQPESPEDLEALREHERAPGDVGDTLDWLSDREVAMFVERLPLAQRQVLVLRFMLDLSGEQIAQVLGRSHLAVRQLQTRALHSLEQRLTAVGRTSVRRGPRPMKSRTKPLTVLARRRFALGIRPPRAAA